MSKTIQLREKDYLQHQWKFITSDKRQSALVGGYGSGKTVAGLAVCLNMHMNKKRPDVVRNGKVIKKGKSAGWVIYPTFNMAELLFITPFLLILRNAQIKFTFKDHMITTKYGTIAIYSLAYPLRFVGSNLTWAYVDLADIGKFKKLMFAWKKLLSRMRGCKNAQIFMTGTPLGYGLLYILFDKPNEEYQMCIHATTRDNIYADKLYIQSLLRSYTKALQLAYVNGRFTNMNKKQAYYSFDRDLHAIQKLQYDMNYPIYIGIDFNVDWFSMCFCQLISNTLYVILLKQFANYHTRLACLYLMHKFGSPKGIIINPDSTGNQRKTSATQTDHDILRLFGFKVLVRNNPLQRDRVSTVNNQLLKDNIEISNDCTILINDLLRVCMTDDGTHLDKSLLTSGVNHMSDAFGYVVVNNLTNTEHRSTMIKHHKYKM